MFDLREGGQKAGTAYRKCQRHLSTNLIETSPVRSSPPPPSTRIVAIINLGGCGTVQPGRGNQRKRSCKPQRNPLRLFGNRSKAEEKGHLIAAGNPPSSLGWPHRTPGFRRRPSWPRQRVQRSQLSSRHCLTRAMAFWKSKLIEFRLKKPNLDPPHDVDIHPFCTQEVTSHDFTLQDVCLGTSSNLKPVQPG